MLKNSDLNNTTVAHTTDSVIECVGVGKTYEHETGSAVHDVHFSIKKGEFVCLIGASGCGKSTVLKMIAGLVEPTLGTLTKPAEVAMDFQTGALFPWLTVYDNVAMGLRAVATPESVVQREVEKYLELTKLSSFAHEYPSQLSGGQRQRVGIARALAINPEVLLLDEPFSALDPKTTSELHDDIIDIWHKTGKTVIMISHLIEEAVSLSDRVILMKEGTVAKIFPINLAYPRREQATDFAHKVLEIRKEFFA